MLRYALSRRRLLGMLSVTLAAPVLAACGAPPRRQSPRPRPPRRQRSRPKLPAWRRPPHSRSQPPPRPLPSRPTPRSRRRRPPARAGAHLHAAAAPAYRRPEARHLHVQPHRDLRGRAGGIHEAEPEYPELSRHIRPCGLDGDDGAGSAPDFYRVQAPDVPTFILRKMAKDLTDSFKDSSVIKMDDLSEANKNYWFDEKLNVGTGKIYGMVKDWSPDLSALREQEDRSVAGVSCPPRTPS